MCYPIQQNQDIMLLYRSLSLRLYLNLSHSANAYIFSVWILQLLFFFSMSGLAYHRWRQWSQLLLCFAFTYWKPCFWPAKTETWLLSPANWNWNLTIVSSQHWTETETCRFTFRVLEQVQPQDSGGEGIYEGLEHWIGSAPTSVPRLQFFVHLSEKKIKTLISFHEEQA